MTPRREPVRVAAVDLGATRGRVMVAGSAPDTLHARGGAPVPERRRATSAARCTGTCSASTARCSPGCATWPRDRARSHGIGIDSWAVDYGLLDARRRSCSATRSATATAAPTGSPAQVLRPGRRDASCTTVTGLQQLPFNTIYQLVAAAGTPALEQAATLLLLPDLLGYWLTGEVGAERTNASTTGLYDVRSRRRGPPTSPSGSACPSVDPAAAARPRATVVGHAAARGRGARSASPPTYP